MLKDKINVLLPNYGRPIEEFVVDTLLAISNATIQLVLISQILNLKLRQIQQNISHMKFGETHMVVLTTSGAKKI